MWKRFISAARAQERIRVVPTRVISPPCGRRAGACQECPGGRLPRVVVAMEVRSPELLLPHGHRWQCWTGLQGCTTGATAQRGVFPSGFVGSPQALQAVLFCLPESFIVFKDNSRVPFIQSVAPWALALPSGCCSLSRRGPARGADVDKGQSALTGT